MIFIVVSVFTIMLILLKYTTNKCVYLCMHDYVCMEGFVGFMHIQYSTSITKYPWVPKVWTVLSMEQHSRSQLFRSIESNPLTITLGLPPFHIGSMLNIGMIGLMQFILDSVKILNSVHFQCS